MRESYPGGGGREVPKSRAAVRAPCPLRLLELFSLWERLLCAFDPPRGWELCMVDSGGRRGSRGND